VIVLLMRMQPNDQKHKTYEVQFVHLEGGLEALWPFLHYQITTITDTARW